MSQHRCPRCKTPVTIPEGKPGVLCPNCSCAVTAEEHQQQRRPRRGSMTLRVTLIAAILAMVGVWLYLGPLAPEPRLDPGEPRAAKVTPRRFVLWELHADDTVRVVDLLTRSDLTKGMPYQVSGQSLRPGDKVLSVKWIGGKLVDQQTLDDVYRGKTYLRKIYWLRISASQYGYDMRINHVPHLHINGERRLISIGVDPKTYRQEIITVAVPVSARLRRIYDYQPYRHIVLDEWDVFYYDPTDIQGHVSIHIEYSPSKDAPSLEWVKVETSR